MTKADQSAAEELVRLFLDKTGASILNGDFATYAACFHLPQRVETFDGIKLLETEDDLRAMYLIVRDWLVNKGATDLARDLLVAEFRGDDLIVGAYETRIMRGTELLADPYPNFSSLARIDGIWKIVDGTYATNIPDLLSSLKSKLDASRQQR